MSFTENPYRWFNFFTTSDESHLIVECRGCGGESDLLPISTPASEIMRVQDRHLAKSHERSRDDFALWSQPNHRDSEVPKEPDPSNISGGDETPDPGVIEPNEPSPEWIPAFWKYVLTGDRIRLNGQEAEVERSSVYNFHADNADPYRPTAWDHTEVSIKLAHLPNSLNFPPNAEVEILMDRERKAIHLLQGTFDATKIGEK